MFRTNYQREPCACRVHATFDSEHGSPQNGQKRRLVLVLILQIQVRSNNFLRWMVYKLC